MDDLDAEEDGLRHAEFMHLVAQIHEAFGPDTPRRLHQFESDFPGWDVEDPFHLWRTALEAATLVTRGIVTPLSTNAER